MSGFKSKFILILLAGLIIMTTSFTGWPEMTFWPYLIRIGWHPYTDFAMVHTPMLIFSLTLFYKLFGFSLLSLKIYTWLTIILSCFCIFLTAKQQKINSNLVIWIFLILFFTYDANGIWFDLALAPLALLIFLLNEKKKYILSGVFFIVAVATKQTAVYWIIPILYQLNGRNLKPFIAGFFLTFPFLLLPFLSAPDFLAAKKWIFDFGVLTFPKVLGQANNINPLRIIFFSTPYLLGLFLLFFKKPKLAVWGLFASLGVLPRWDLFHFLPGISFMSLGLVSLSKNHPVTKIILTLVCLVMLFVSIKSKFQTPDRFWDPATQDVSLYIRQNSNPTDCLYVLNYWDNIYQMSGRTPCTRPWYPYLPQYLNLPGVKNEIYDDIITHPPKLIVRYPHTVSGLGSDRIPPLESFIVYNYTIIKDDQGLQILRRN